MYDDIVLGDRPKSVSRAHPCPFCDHDDWCFMVRPTKPEMPGGANGVIFVCMRIGGIRKGDRIGGSDGNTYMCLEVTKNGAPMMEDVRQYAIRHPNSKMAGEMGGADASAQTLRNEPFRIEPEIQPLPAEKLNLAYKTMFSMLKLEPRHREKLHRDGMSDEVIRFNMIASLPEADGYRYKHRNYQTVNPTRRDVAEKVRSVMGGSIEGIPGFYYNSVGKAQIAGLGGILYPQFDLFGRIVAVRIGVDRRWYDDKGNDITKEEYEHAAAEAKAIGERTKFVQFGKYMNLASYKEDSDALKNRIIRNQYRGGCRSGNHLGIYKAPGKVDLKVVYITEGEKKAMIAAEKLHSVVIDVPGVSSHGLLYMDTDVPSPLATLKRAGTRALVVAYDADKSHNDAVLNAEKGLCDALAEMGFGIAVAEWDEAQGKGLDDLMVNGGDLRYDVRRKCSF